MATFTINFNIKDEKFEAWVNDLATFNGWTAKVPDPTDESKLIDNPVTKETWAKRVIRQMAKDNVRLYRLRERVRLAESAEEDDGVN